VLLEIDGKEFDILDIVTEICRGSVVVIRGFDEYRRIV